jgi:hypothetical protein
MADVEFTAQYDWCPVRHVMCVPPDRVRLRRKEEA